MQLVPVTADDAGIYSALRNDDDTYKWFFSGKKFKEGDVREWLENAVRSTGEWNYFGKDGGDIIGAVSLYGSVPTAFSAEVGRIMVSSKYRGRGYGVMLLNAIKGIAYNKGLESLFAYIMPDNIASIKIFKSAGYVLDEELIPTNGALVYIRAVDRSRL